MVRLRDKDVDSAVMARIAAGDESGGAALRELMKRHGGLVRSILKSRVPRRDIDDIMQDVWMKVWKYARSFDAGIAPLKTWIAVIAHRAAIEHLRRPATHKMALESDAGIALRDERHTREPRSSESDRLDRLASSLELIDPRLREHQADRAIDWAAGGHGEKHAFAGAGPDARFDEGGLKIDDVDN